MNLKEQNLVTSTILLTATSLFTRTIGMISSIYLAQILGAEGMGIYELSMSLYMTAVIFASAGLSVTVSRMIAEALGQKQMSSLPHIMKVAFFIGLSLSFIVTILLFSFSPFLGAHFIHNTSAISGLRLLSLSIPFMACSSCFKGYFYATKKTIYPATADILEQVVKLCLVMTLIKLYTPNHMLSLYSAVGLGLTIGEIVSWSYMLSLYIHEAKHFKKLYSHSTSTSSKEQKQLAKFSDDSIPRYLCSSNQLRINLVSLKVLLHKMLSIMLPIACISYLSCLFFSLENSLIPLSLKKYNDNLSASMSVFGMIKGMIMPILFFPSAFLTAFSTTLIPEIARANVLRLHKRVTYTTSRVLQLTFILSLLVVAIFMNYSDELGFVLYKSEEIGPLLRSLSIIVPFIYTEAIADGILKGLDEQVSCLKYSIIDSIMRILLIYFLLPIKGIYAFVGITIISCILTSTLSFNKLLETTHLKFKLMSWLVKPAVAATFSASYSRLIIYKLFRYSFGLTIKVILGISFTVLLYIPLLFLIQTLSIEDLSWLKRQLRLFRTTLLLKHSS